MGDSARVLYSYLVLHPSRVLCLILLALAASVSARAEEPQADALAWVLPTLEPMSWQAADALCSTLEHGGHDDWRLPSIEELTARSGSIAADLRRELREKAPAVWACRPPDAWPSLRATTPHERAGWRYRFDMEQPFFDWWSLGSSLCVRGGPPSRTPLSASEVVCLQVVDSGEPLQEPVAREGVLLEGLGKDGAVEALGRTSETGSICLRRSDVQWFAWLVACEGSGCGAVEPHQQLTAATLILDPTRRGRQREGRLCLTALGERQPTCGARVYAIGMDGDLRRLGKTGVSGRQCIRRGRLDDTRYVLLCSRSTCRAVPRSLLGSKTELLVDLPDILPSCGEPRATACPGYCEDKILCTF